jgi:hypothetical protein
MFLKAFKYLHPPQKDRVIVAPMASLRSFPKLREAWRETLAVFRETSPTANRFDRIHLCCLKGRDDARHNTRDHANEHGH